MNVETAENLAKFFKSTGFAGIFVVAIALVVWIMAHFAAADVVSQHEKRLTAVETKSEVTHELLLDVRSTVRAIANQVGVGKK